MPRACRSERDLESEPGREKMSSSPRPSPPDEEREEEGRPDGFDAVRGGEAVSAPFNEPPGSAGIFPACFEPAISRAGMPALPGGGFMVPMHDLVQKKASYENDS